MTYKGFKFSALQGKCKEVYGVLEKDGKILESGFYRTKDRWEAFRTALMNHGFEWLDVIHLSGKEVSL